MVVFVGKEGESRDSNLLEVRDVDVLVLLGKTDAARGNVNALPEKLRSGGVCADQSRQREGRRDVKEGIATFDEGNGDRGISDVYEHYFSRLIGEILGMSSCDLYLIRSIESHGISRDCASSQCYISTRIRDRCEYTLHTDIPVVAYLIVYVVTLTIRYPYQRIKSVRDKRIESINIRQVPNFKLFTGPKHNRRCIAP